MEGIRGINGNGKKYNKDLKKEFPTEVAHLVPLSPPQANANHRYVASAGAGVPRQSECAGRDVFSQQPLQSEKFVIRHLRK